MGIKKKEFYFVECDICGEKLVGSGGDGFGVFESREDADNHARYADWSKKNGKWACEGCYEEL